MQREEHVRELSDKVFEKLIAKSKEADSDTKGLTTRYIPSIQLRDEELPNHGNAKRQSLWEDVSKIVEANSNVVSQPKEVHGEIMKVWEWIR